MHLDIVITRIYISVGKFCKTHFIGIITRPTSLTTVNITITLFTIQLFITDGSLCIRCTSPNGIKIFIKSTPSAFGKYQTYQQKFN